MKDFCRSQRWPVRTRSRVLRYPDWLAYATAVLEANGYEAILADFIAENRGVEDVRRLVILEKPDVVVIDATTPSIFQDIKCAEICKEFCAYTVLVGPHATALPEETLKVAKGCVDFIARGEYDFTILELVECLDKERKVSEVRGLSYLEKGQVRHNPSRPLIEDLDALPFPAWHHLDIRKYYNSIYDYPYLDLISGRGCPYNCTFCQWPQVMHGRRYRFRSPENVVDELERDFERFRVREVFFEDDTFTANRKRAKEICKEILRRKLDVKWSCNSRCDVLDMELLRLMKKAGCRMLLVGPESGFQEILNNVHKGLKIDTIRAFIKLAKKANLQLHACYVIGLPGETKETIELTIRFAKELDTDTIQVAGAMPHVGTEFFEWAEKNGYLRATSWSKYTNDGEQVPLIEYPNLSSKDINDNVDRLYKEYYFNPRRIIKLLLSTDSLSDFYRKMRAAYNLMDYFLKKPR